MNMPEREDITPPIGLMYKLAQNDDALNFLESLDGNQKAAVINYVKGSTTGDEAKKRIDNTINHLKQGNIDFV